MPTEVQHGQAAVASSSSTTTASGGGVKNSGSAPKENVPPLRNQRRRREVSSTHTDDESGGEAVTSPKDFSDSTSALKRYLRKTYGRRAAEQVNRYIRSMFDLAAYANNSAFLSRCRAMRVVPQPYRVDCQEVKYTRQIIRILDDCSYRLMLADLDYNRLRKMQVTRLLERLHEKLEKTLSQDDLRQVVEISRKRYEKIFEETREMQRKLFDELLEEYHIEPRAPKQPQHGDTKKEE